ncbi:AAA family ATPase [Streptomyces sp. NPDC002138]|uniref:AAA family ATPase n=1 Tax=Streptomyces sp. NPDC002138 TaxID=3154410 RepID=UPI0033206648
MSRPAAGGENLHRYAHLVNKIAEGRLQARLTQAYGARFTRSESTGAWELAGVDAGLRDAFSRHRQVVELVGEGASRERQKTAARKSTEAEEEAGPGAPRQAWRTRAAVELGGEAAVDAMVARDGGRGEDAALRAVVAAADRADRRGARGGGARGPPGRLQSWPSHPPSALHAHDGRGRQARRDRVRDGRIRAATGPADRRGRGDDARRGRGRPCDRRRRFPRSRRFSPRRPRQHRRRRRRPRRRRPLLRRPRLRRPILPRPTLRAQRRAARRRDAAADRRARVDAVVGVAGAGKTTLLRAARAGWEAAGLRVLGASTAAVAAANLAAEAGVDSRTVAAWTREISDGRGLHGVGVLAIDEAAMVDDRALAALVRHAADTGTGTGTKVVAVGDPLQLRAVGIGGALTRRVLGAKPHPLRLIRTSGTPR